MKAVIGAFLILALTMFISLTYNFYLNKAVSEINEDISELRSYFDKSDYENAKKTFKTLKTKWEKKEEFIQIETEHSELDIINEQLAILTAHFNHNEYDEFYEALYKLEFFINHIREKKELNPNTLL